MPGGGNSTNRSAKVISAPRAGLRATNIKLYQHLVKTCISDARENCCGNPTAANGARNNNIFGDGGLATKGDLRLPRGGYAQDAWWFLVKDRFF